MSKFSLFFICMAFALCIIFVCCVVGLFFDVVSYIVYRRREKRYIEEAVQAELHDFVANKEKIERYIRREAGREFRRMYRYERL